MINQNSNTHVKLTLKDAQNSETIPWASVYLIPDGDTTITHFALSNDKGDVLLKDVPVGKYEVNAEIIGILQGMVWKCQARRRCDPDTR